MITMKEFGGFLVGLLLLAVGAVEVQQFKDKEPCIESEIKECVPEIRTEQKVELGSKQLHRNGW